MKGVEGSCPSSRNSIVDIRNADVGLLLDSPKPPGCATGETLRASHPTCWTRTSSFGPRAPTVTRANSEVFHVAAAAQCHDSS